MVTRPILIRPPDTSVAGSWRCFQWKPWLQRYERWPTYGGIEVHVIDRPGKRFLGGGETGQGPASIANAIAAATGKWLRDCRANRLGNIRSLSVQSLLKKYSGFQKTQITLYPPLSCPS